MGDSVHKACSFITALALSVIAVQLIPFSRDKELSNYCREYLALLKVRPDKETSQKIIDKRGIIATKTGLSVDIQQINDYCNSFYLNQK
jgi:hypothetical protein